jgi:large subunit ribosomal protein L17
MRKLKLSKKSQPRKRLLKNLVSSLILFEQITTTAPKAKALKGEMQSLISKLKSMDNEVNSKRYLASVLYGGAKVKAYDFKDLYKEVKLFKLGRRFGDNAETVMVKLVREETKTAKSAEKKDKATKVTKK